VFLNITSIKFDRCKIYLLLLYEGFGFKNCFPRKVRHTPFRGAKDKYLLCCVLFCILILEVFLNITCDNCLIMCSRLEKLIVLHPLKLSQILDKLS